MRCSFDWMSMGTETSSFSLPPSSTFFRAQPYWPRSFSFRIPAGWMMRDYRLQGWKFRVGLLDGWGMRGGLLVSWRTVGLGIVVFHEIRVEIVKLRY